MTETTNLQTQIDDLQAQVSFQEDTIEQLNTIVTRQDAIIRKMEQRFAMLGEKIADMESQIPSKGFDPIDEVPPHF